jgi:hypothetical protein
MPFNPVERMNKLRAKRNAQAAAKTVVKKSRRHANKRGPLSRVESAIVAEIVENTPTKALSEVQTTALAIALDRKPSAIADVIKIARERLQENAGKYVDLHIDAAMQALATNEVDVARKAAEWAIEKISARSEDGSRVSIVDTNVNESSGPKIMIGIALGGMKPLVD